MCQMKQGRSERCARRCFMPDVCMMAAAFAGSDRTALLYQITAGASIIAVMWATMYRIANRRPTRPGRHVEKQHA